MSFISKALHSAHLGVIPNLWRGLGIQGLIRASASKKSQNVLKYMALAGGAVSGASALGAFGGGAAGAGAGGAGGAGGLTEFGVGDLSALGGTSGELGMAADTAGAAGLTDMAPSAAANVNALGGTGAKAVPYMKYARMANSVMQSSNKQDQQPDDFAKTPALSAPASDATAVPQKKTFIGTALTALQTGRPQQMGGADAALPQ